MIHRLLLYSAQAQRYAELLSAYQLPNLEVIVTGDEAEALAAAPGCDLAFGEPIRLRQIIPHMPLLLWAQATFAGVEPLVADDMRRDYLLTNARAVFGRLMVEYVFGYLLLRERRMLEALEAQREKRWDHTPPGTLQRKVIGLLGVGSIGADLAHAAKLFGMTVKGFTRGSRECAAVDHYFHSGQEQAFCAGLDVLVCSLPNTPHTSGLVNTAFLAALPARAIFINVGRGGVVDETALLSALYGGRLAGAVLDVFQQEPLPPGHPLWDAPNTIITAHTSALSFPGDIVPIFVENFRRMQADEALLYIVDFARGY